MKCCIIPSRQFYLEIFRVYIVWTYQFNFLLIAMFALELIS